MENILLGSDERIERHLADERAKERASRVSPAASSKAVAKAYPGASTVRFEAEEKPKDANPITTLRVLLREPYTFGMTGEEKDQVREYLKADRELHDVIMANTRDAVWARYKGTPPPPEGRIPREVAEEQAREVMRHAKQQRAELPSQYAPLLLDLCARAVEEVELRLNGEEERNASQCEQLGIPAEDTGPIRALRGALALIRARQSSIETDPRNATFEIAEILLGDL